MEWWKKFVEKHSLDMHMKELISEQFKSGQIRSGVYLWLKHQVCGVKEGEVMNRAALIVRVIFHPIARLSRWFYSKRLTGDIEDEPWTDSYIIFGCRYSREWLITMGSNRSKSGFFRFTKDNGVPIFELAPDPKCNHKFLYDPDGPTPIFDLSCGGCGVQLRNMVYILKHKRTTG